MTLSAFDDKTKPPEDRDLAAVLGKSFSLWNSLKCAVSDDHAPLAEEWGYTGKSTGWGFRLKKKDRVLLYMTPCRGFFLASFAFGEKAVQSAHNAKLPAGILAIIDAAPRYAEGRGVRIEVRTAKDVAAVKQLVAIKAAS